MSGPRPVHGPLDGLRIIDLTVALAGAFSTMLLADLGAEVIKVESRRHYQAATKGPRNPPRGDDQVSFSAARDYADADPGPDPWNRLSWFNSHARNKLDATMEIGTAEGRELFLRLVARSDGLVENNAAGFLEKLDIGPERLLEVNPRLVVVRMPPLGLWGPDARATGFGWHFEELGGYLQVQGYRDGVTVGSVFMDGASGPAGANAFLMGLHRLRRTGQGSVCEVAQVENLVCHIGDLTTGAAVDRRSPQRWGNRSPDFAPQGCYPAAGPDEWLVLSVRGDAEWTALLGVLGDSAGDLARDDLGTVDGRREAHDEIDVALASWTSGRGAADAAATLQAAGIPAGPVLDEAAASSDPQLHQREFFQMLTHPSAGTHFHGGANFRLSATPARLWRAAPTLGQDNDYVYKEVLGVSDDEYAMLEAEGHIGTDYA